MGFVLVALAEVGILVATLLLCLPLGERGTWAVAVVLLMLSLAAAGLTLLFSRFRSSEESSRRMRLLAEMNVEVNRDILLNEDIELIYRTILDYLFCIFDKVNTGSILILAEDGYLSFAASRGFTEDYVRTFRLKLEDSFLYQETGGSITETRLITQETFLRLVTRFQPVNWDYKSVISAPIFVGERLFGILNLDSDKPGTFDAEDARIVERFRAQIEVCLLARSSYQSGIERYRVDSLTGLFTRRFFEDLFNVSLERAQRYGETFVVALFDVDGLKTVNDSFGHLAGDQVLLAIANALRASCRKSDIIGRFGGDEFIAFYQGAEAEAMERSIANILATLRSRPMDFEGQAQRLSFSFGLARFPEEGTELVTLTEVADRRLYAMKTASR